MSHRLAANMLEYASGRDEAIQYLHERHQDYVPEPLRAVEDLPADGDAA